MPAIVSSEAVETCLRAILLTEGYTLSPPLVHGQTGVDIIATRDGAETHIEVIAYKSSGPARAKDFYEAFFRAVSRLSNGADRCVIALSHLAAVGLPARARQHGIAWQRLGEAFPELEIWLVNTEDASYARSGWNDWFRPV